MPPLLLYIVKFSVSICSIFLLSFFVHILLYVSYTCKFYLNRKIIYIDKKFILIKGLVDIINDPLRGLTISFL